MSQLLLSVIVPCYNAENTLDKCISSILGQTYSNLDVLIVNDGSTDKSGDICVAWEKKDARIKVIHKQNEGLPYARKTGVEAATAEFVTFVDSDDWIDTDMYTNMMTALISTNSDIAQCGVCDVYPYGRIVHRRKTDKDGLYEVVGRAEGVTLILEDAKWQSYMPNKIFKKHLFHNIVFPKGRFMDEDVTIAHTLFHNASQSVYLQDEYYFYLRNMDASWSLQREMKLCYDRCNARYERYLFVEQHPEYHHMLSYAKNIVFTVSFATLRDVIIYPKLFPENWFEVLASRLKSIPYSKKELLPMFISRFKKIEMSTFFFSPKLYRVAVRILGVFSKIKPFFKKGLKLFGKIKKISISIDHSRLDLPVDVSKIPKIYGFYHILCSNDWKNVVSEQVDAMQKSGLYDLLNKVHVCVITENVEDIHYLTDYFPEKFEIVIQSNNRKEYEYPILQYLYRKSNSEDFLCFYFHTKGVSYSEKQKRMKTGQKSWRTLMDYFIFEKHNLAIHALQDGYSCYGSLPQTVKNYTFFMGNFWWSSSKYINTLVEPSPRCALMDDAELEGNDRMYAEHWIGHISTCKPYITYISFVDFYTNPIPEVLYNDRKIKISDLLPIMKCYLHHILNCLSYRLKFT